MCDTIPVMETCATCGKTYQTGEWPWCPHGIPQGMLGEFHTYVDFNIAHEPVEISSLAQRNRLMKEHKLEHRSPRVGRKGCEL